MTHVQGLRSTVAWSSLAALLLAGTSCSTENWTAPQAAPQTAAPARRAVDTDTVARLTEALTLVMEERDLWVLEVEDEEAGLRLSLDRRGSAAPAMVMAPAGTGSAASGPAATGPSASGPAAGTSAGPATASGPKAAAPAKPRASTESPTAAAKGGDMAAGPKAAIADEFHPDNVLRADGTRAEAPAPVYGGRVIVHLSSLPKHMNYVTENSAVTRRMLYETHETLLHQDWEFHDLRPRVAEGYTVEDILVLQPGVEESYPQAKALKVRPLDFTAPFDGFVLFGQVEKTGGGWRVQPQSEGGSALSGPVVVPEADTLAVELGAVVTMQLREGVRWQPAKGDADGRAYDIRDQFVDARDVYFSWLLYQNPEVNCDEKRFQFVKFPDCEVLGPLELRFFCQEQYFQSLTTLGTSLTILPSHLYDLSDPDNPWHNPNADSSEQALHINENPHNQLWIGVGPYQVTEWSQQYVEAKRYPGYFNPDDGGYVDVIRWRYIADDNTAFSAVLNRELDFFERVKTSDYFGAGTERKEFTDHYYKGYKYLGTYGYTGWNTHRDYLSDKRVRQALAHAFPFDEYLRTAYQNLARQVTGPFPYASEAYDHSVEAFPLDYDRARELLEEAGFFDTDGNGIVDRDGRDLVIEFMMPSGNDASRSLGLTMQENFGRIGVKVEFAAMEWATFLDRMKKREFDGVNLAWVPPLESDPEQIWHSRWGQPDVESSNNSGLRDPVVDEMILRGTRELDHKKRQAIWREMHAYLYELQPYLFGYNVPQKFAMSKRIRGFQTFAIDPGYEIRRWHFTSLDEPGTRPTR